LGVALGSATQIGMFVVRINTLSTYKDKSLIYESLHQGNLITI